MSRVESVRYKRAGLFRAEEAEFPEAAISDSG